MWVRLADFKYNRDYAWHFKQKVCFYVWLQQVQPRLFLYSSLLMSGESKNTAMNTHFISFRFTSFQFILFYFTSFHFIPFIIIPFHSIPFHFFSFQFISFLFITLHFILLCWWPKVRQNTRVFETCAHSCWLAPYCESVSFTFMKWQTMSLRNKHPQAQRTLNDLKCLSSQASKLVHMIGGA